MKKINIIGAGISGLCAGCYLRMNGYETEIFELHDLPGGLCTAWDRKGYTFDGCLHWLAGSSPVDPFYRLWNELIDMPSIEFVVPEEQYRFMSSRGEVLTLYSDIKRLEKELREKAPADADFIDRLIREVRRFQSFEMPVDKPPELMSIGEKLRMMIKLLPFMRSILKYGKISVAEVGKKCHTPLLRAALTHHPLFDNFALFGLIMTMVWYSKRTAGYPVGGSRPFARRFERRYTELGGRIRFGARVSKIIVENDRARGVVLENGETHESDIVISAADGHATIYDLLNGKYTDKKIEALYAGRNKALSPFPSLVYVSLGVSRKLEDQPHQIVYHLEEPIPVDGTLTHRALNTTTYNFDPTLAPEGKTCINVMFESYGHEYWTDLRENHWEKYREEKKRIADRVIEILDQKMGDIRRHVEVVDVATPATFFRYTNNWRGSYEGWLPAPGALTLSLKKELPGLKDFFQIGQWVEPGGGLPPALRSARNVAQIICRRDGKRFTVKAHSSG